MMHQAVCGCESPTCPAEGGGFYVSARRDSGDHVFLLGPFSTHEDALRAVGIGESLAYRTDPRAPWYAYGTARTDDKSVATKVLFQPCQLCGELLFYRAVCPCQKETTS